MLTPPSSARLDSLRLVRATRIGCLTLLGSAAAAIAQQPTWLREIGSFSDDAAKTVAATPDGGCFVAGDTLGPWFPGAIGGEDAFQARFDGAGTLLWGSQFGTSASASVRLALADGARGDLDLRPD